jgi:uncharacterized protein
MTSVGARVKVRFGGELAAWHYPGTNGGCVIMTGGLAVTKEPGTDRFAQRFHAAGFSVLAFDPRRMGESGGQPRQVVRLDDDLADWHAAIGFAGTLPEVDPAKVAIWSFSLNGGHIFRVAADHPDLAAAIAQTPNADGLAASRNAARHQTPAGLARTFGRALLDLAGGLLGRRPLLVPLVGEPGTVAALTTPDAIKGPGILDPGNLYPDWNQTIAARSIPSLTRYRPGRSAARIRVPLLVVVADEDQSALAAPAAEAARRAPHGVLLRVEGDHYAPFTDAHDQVVEAEVDFLRLHLLHHPTPDPRRPAAPDDL